MGSSIVLKLLNVTHYYRNKKNKKWYLPYGYEAEDIELNNISLHLYQGEALGLIGEPGSSKELVARILAGEVPPDKGKCVRKSDLFFADLHDKPFQRSTVMDYVKQTLTLYPYEVKAHQAEQILKYTHLYEEASKPIHALTDTQYAQLLLGLARISHSSILILNHVIGHLDESYFKEAIELTNHYINNELTMVIVDDEIERLPQVTNYLAWISHGQVRMEGSIRQVLPLFKEHERDRASLNTEEERQHFDLDWKKSRSRIPELTYNFKRVERYNHAKPPVVFTRFWTLLAAFLLGAVLMVPIMFNNLGKLPVPTNTDQATIQNRTSNPYDEMMAYGIVQDNDAKLTALDKTSNLSAPHYSLLTITGENSKSYRVVVDHHAYRIDKSAVRYFDPAGLYEKHSRQTLAPYMQKNYINYYEYFNSHLHKDRKKSTDSLVPEKGKDNRFVTPITQQPISMLFDDENQVTGFVYPIKDKSKLKDAFNVDGSFWITKSSDGYYIADLNNNKWIYIKL